MVSKVAVLAMVVIIAVPILVGYALNVETEEGTRYVQDGDATDVTGLLTNNITYTYTSANINEMNFDNMITSVYGSTSKALNIPIYNVLSNTKSTIALNRTTLGASYDLTTVYYMSVNVPPNQQSYLGLTVSYGNSQTYTYSDMVYNIYYSKNDAKIWISERSGSSSITSEFQNPTAIAFNQYHSDYTVEIASAATLSGSKYVDIAAGWRFRDSDHSYTVYDYYASPSDATDMLVSMDIDSPVYWTGGPYMILETNDRTDFDDPASNPHVVWLERISGQWTATADPDNPVDRVTLPYSTEISNNTYQIRFMKTGIEINYIGGWSDAIGQAPAYWSHTFEFSEADKLNDNEFVKGFSVLYAGDEPTDITFRVDNANVLSHTYRNISNISYDPFYMTGKANPATTLTGVARAGSSIVFGGLTFDVTNNTITVDGKTLPVNGLKLSSTATDASGNLYTNTINGHFVSNTVYPSNVRFNGMWNMDVSTYAQASEEFSEVHWIPGGFAWEGVGFDFYLVGLITSIGAFIALAMYGRASGAKVGSLMLVCGGAAFMFILLM